MKKMKKAVGRWISLALILAMSFSLNLTSLTVNAAISKPTSSTVVSNPGNVYSATMDDVSVKFYKDNNGDQIYLRRIYPNNTELADLKNVVVIIQTSDYITSEEASVTHVMMGKWRITADLSNSAPEIKIGDVSCILAAGIQSGSRTPTADGYVTGVKINGTDASVTRFVANNPCPGNLYYTTGTSKPIPWNSITNYIEADGVAKPSNLAQVPLTYSIIGKSTGSTTVNLSSGTASTTIGSHLYTVRANFASSAGFVASKNNFWIDFQELRNSTDPVPSQDALDRAAEIEEVVDAYYADPATQKEFPDGATCMDVIQSILKYGVEIGKFTTSDTTVGDGVTYISQINGLGEFDVGSLSGWMYTNNPDSGIDYRNWNTPPVGGADYVLSPDSTIAWFYVVDYGTHPWN